jgi:addiction module HigA family antidote
LQEAFQWSGPDLTGRWTLRRICNTSPGTEAHRVTLSRVLNGASGIFADMAIRLGQALGTSAELWAGMQLQYDLFVAQHQDRPNIARLAAA